MFEQPLHVFIVDDDPAQLRVLERLLTLEGFEVTTAEAALGVSNLVRHYAPDVVLLDVNIPALTGDRLLTVARQHAPPDTKWVLVSACDEDELRAIANLVKADGWMSKSLPVSQMAAQLRKLCGRRPSGV
jgi:two-component system OmpR family response regulator